MLCSVVEPEKLLSFAYRAGEAIELSAARVLDGKYHKKASAVHILIKDFPKFPSTRIHPDPGPDQIVSTGLFILPIVTCMLDINEMQINIYVYIYE